MAIISSGTPLTRSETIELEELVGFSSITQWSGTGAVLNLNATQVRQLVQKLRGPVKKGH